jgi:hypothetical protein
MIVDWDIISKSLLVMKCKNYFVHGDLVRFFNLSMRRALLVTKCKIPTP